MAKRVWKSAQTFDKKQATQPTWKQIKANPSILGYTADQVAVKTIPGQSQTVKEILDRYEKGRPEVVE